MSADGRLVPPGFGALTVARTRTEDFAADAKARSIAACAALWLASMCSRTSCSIRSPRSQPVLMVVMRIESHDFDHTLNPTPERLLLLRQPSPTRRRHVCPVFQAWGSGGTEPSVGQEAVVFLQSWRQANVHDIVLRSISGHLTETMQERYSTAQQLERRAAVGNVIAIATARQIRRRRAKRRL